MRGFEGRERCLKSMYRTVYRRARWRFNTRQQLMRIMLIQLNEDSASHIQIRSVYVPKWITHLLHALAARPLIRAAARHYIFIILSGSRYDGHLISTPRARHLVL
jgi:hypothetical protein